MNIIKYMKDYMTVLMEHYIIINMMYMNDTKYIKIHSSQFIEFIQKYVSLIKSFHILVQAEIDLTDKHENNINICHSDLLTKVLEISITISEYYNNIMKYVYFESSYNNEKICVGNVILMITHFLSKFTPDKKIKNIYDQILSL